MWEGIRTVHVNTFFFFFFSISFVKDVDLSPSSFLSLCLCFVILFLFQVEWGYYAGHPPEMSKLIRWWRPPSAGSSKRRKRSRKNHTHTHHIYILYCYYYYYYRKCISTRIEIKRKKTLRLLEMRDGTNMTRLVPRRLLLPSPMFRVFFFFLFF
jgi:hypothetical protein